MNEKMRKLGRTGFLIVLLEIIVECIVGAVWAVIKAVTKCIRLRTTLTSVDAEVHCKGSKAYFWDTDFVWVQLVVANLRLYALVFRIGIGIAADDICNSPDGGELPSGYGIANRLEVVGRAFHVWICQHKVNARKARRERRTSY